MSQPPSSDDVNKKVGCVLILSNQLPDGDKLYRQYAEMMRRVWCEHLKCKLFEDNIHFDKSCEDMTQIFERLGNSKEAFGCDYLVVVIIARGGIIQSLDETYNPHIFGNDGESLLEDCMFSYFRNDTSTWQGKPKTFILGYSRYKGPDNESSGRVINNQSPQPAIRSWKVWDIVNSNVDPVMSEILRVYGEPSTRLILEIYEVFSKDWEDDPAITKLLTTVNDRMINVSKSYSVYESTLTESLQLFSGCTMPQCDVDKKDIMQLLREMNEDKPSIISRQEMTRAKLKTLELLKMYPHLVKVNENQFVEAERDMENELKEIRDRQPRKGCVLIIGNPLDDESNFHEKDIQMMERLWRDTLHCDLVGDKAHTRQNAAMMYQRLEKLTKMKNTDRYDYVVVVISSHGFMSKKNGDGSYTPNRQYFVGSDEELVDERKVLSMFTDPCCGWRDKVKIFLLDYCRGENIDYGSPAEKLRVEKRLEIEENILPPYILPVIKESFIVHSTHYDYVALANRLTLHVGDVFTKLWNERSVASMLTLVNKRVKHTDAAIKTMSIFMSTVTTDFHLYQE